MNLTIELSDADLQALEAKAAARGVSAEQYALQVLEQDLASDWLRESWAGGLRSGVDPLSASEIEAEVAAARRDRRDAKPQPST